MVSPSLDDMSPHLPQSLLSALKADACSVVCKRLSLILTALFNAKVFTIFIHSCLKHNLAPDKTVFASSIGPPVSKIVDIFPFFDSLVRLDFIQLSALIMILKVIKSRTLMISFIPFTRYCLFTPIY